MRKLLLGVLIGSGLAVQAQQVIPCVTDEVHYQMQQQNPQLAIEEARSNDETRKIAERLMQNTNFAKKGSVMIIPVVFHVIHQNGLENISQAQMMDQIRILNEDFRKKAGTNGGKSTEVNATDMEIEFRLAQNDPSGKRHDGINRIESSYTNGDALGNRDLPKSLVQWDPKKYLNIWVVKSIYSGGSTGTILGFAQFPYSLSSQSSTDGIVIRADYVGLIQTGNVSNGGRTLTHEIGHWIGLYHTFQGGCAGQTASNCAYGGDQVCDTPPVSEANYGSNCAASLNSCNGDSPDLKDMITNYMDYMDGSCANTYTVGQKARAYAQMAAYRSIVYSSSNLNAAGLNTAGDYLTVAPSIIKAPYSYGFEDADITAAGWRIQNLNNGSNAWKSDAVAYSGNKSIAFRNFSNTTAILNSRDEFNSPLIDLSSLTNAKLTFKVAYARKASNTNDILDVMISGDFGRTETRLFRGTLATLETQGVTTTEFVPTSTTQWREISIDLASFLTLTNARIRFEFNNRKGNNIFIDDFAISTSTGLNQNIKQELAFNLIPNPMTDVAIAQFELKQPQAVEINICDLSGRKITTVQNGQMQAGMYSLPINRNQLANGIYLLEVRTNQGTFAQKLVVN